MSCHYNCSVVLPHCAVGWYAVCDWGLKIIQTCGLARGHGFFCRWVTKFRRRHQHLKDVAHKSHLSKTVSKSNGEKIAMS